MVLKHGSVRIHLRMRNMAKVVGQPYPPNSELAGRSSVLVQKKNYNGGEKCAYLFREAG